MFDLYLLECSCGLLCRMDFLARFFLRNGSLVSTTWYVVFELELFNDLCSININLFLFDF